MGNSVKNSINLPRRALSYSAINLWYKDKNQYRKRYYEGIYPPDTKYTLFGKQAEEQVYAGKLPGVPYFGTGQHKLFCEVEGVPVIGYLDDFNKKTHQFIDYKSGIRKKDGAPRWTKYDVHSLDQLPFYSFLIEQIYGKVHSTALLVWLETGLKKPDTLLNNGEEVYLTGEYEVFERFIPKWERERMKDYIVTAAKEISQDYFLWQGGVENPPRFGFEE